MRKLILAALAVAIASPAVAGGYGCRDYGSCKLPGPGAYGYYYGGHYGVGGDLAPPPAPPPPPVMVEPFACEPKDKLFIPRFNKHVCRPQAVQPYNGNGGYGGQY
jgi:hypothetical protein